MVCFCVYGKEQGDDMKRGQITPQPRERFKQELLLAINFWVGLVSEKKDAQIRTSEKTRAQHPRITTALCEPCQPLDLFFQGQKGACHKHRYYEFFPN
jgi:hypothetical protein